MEYVKRFTAIFQGSQMQEYDLLKETEEICERSKKNKLEATFQEVCLGDNKEMNIEMKEGKAAFRQLLPIMVNF